MSAVSSVLVFVLPLGFVAMHEPISAVQGSFCSSSSACAVPGQGGRILPVPASGRGTDGPGRSGAAASSFVTQEGMEGAGAEWQGDGAPLGEDPAAHVPVGIATPGISPDCVEQQGETKAFLEEPGAAVWLWQGVLQLFCAHCSQVLLGLALLPGI